MGVPLGSNLMAMMENHSDQECHYVILVNTVTGERMRVDFSEKETSLPATILSGCDVG